MGVAVDPGAHPRYPVEQVDHIERRAGQRVVGDLGDRDRGGETVCPPSVETATTCRLGTCLLSAFSVQNASTVPVLDTVICPGSRNPWPQLLPAPPPSPPPPQPPPPSPHSPTPT